MVMTHYFYYWCWSMGTFFQLSYSNLFLLISIGLLKFRRYLEYGSYDRAAGLFVFVIVDIMPSTNGLPKRTPIQTINSLYNITPINTAITNFCGPYLVRPNVM
jgi:hypothetical protein